MNPHDPNAPIKDADMRCLMDDWTPPGEGDYFSDIAEHEADRNGFDPDAPNPSGDFSPDIVIADIHIHPVAF